jgi:hypothetical protein
LRGAVRGKRVSRHRGAATAVGRPRQDGRSLERRSLERRSLERRSLKRRREALLVGNGSHTEVARGTHT